MRHKIFGRKLSRNTDERKRLLVSLVRDLLVRDFMVTTIAKAKSIQPIVEKLITRAKAGSEADGRRVEAALGDRVLAEKLMEDAKTRFANRTSGFTRVIKVGKRLGDATDTAMISFVDAKIVAEVIKPKKEEQKVEKPSKVEKKTSVKKEKTVKKAKTKNNL